jgi:hypothetical protein
LPYYGNSNVSNNLLFGRPSNIQGGYQFVGFLISFGIGIGSGIITGLILRIWRSLQLP